MKYTLDNGKSVNIPTKEIENLMASLGLSQADAIDLWLCDNDYEEDEEQAELDEKAKKIKINKDIVLKKSKKERKPPKKVVSSEKQTLFNDILNHLTENYGENVKILTENKLISIEINGITFKIDVIQTRSKK